MGRLQAEEMAGMLSLDQALAWHLASNHFPPLPPGLLGPAKAAIAAAADDDWDRDIDLCGEASWRDRDSAPAWACIEGWHLDAFVEGYYYDWEEVSE